MIDLAAPPFTLLAERDMDLLVLEEMLSSDPFRKWLVGKLYNGTHQLRRLIGAWHTPSLEPLGSVDILFVFEDMATGHKCAILIENKIDQPKQNLQAQRYFEFGEKGIEDRYWDEYLTCLFSPQAYFSSLEPSEYFSSYLSYEEIENWFSRAAAETHSATIERSAYKKTLIRQAIEQGRRIQSQIQKNERPDVLSKTAPVAPEVPASPSRGRQNTTKSEVSSSSSRKEQKTAPQAKGKISISDFRVFPGGVFNLPAGYREAEDTIIGAFFNDLLSYTEKYYPELGMKKPSGSAAEAAWVEFAPQEFPRDIRIIHKMPQGFMDLSFAMTALSTIQAPYQPYIDNDMAFKENGKTAIIRIAIPPVDPQQGFEAQKDTIEFALQKAQKLYQLYVHVVDGGTTGKGYAPEELYF
ncbi:MAG: PD-(D/E)XK nuclease family protein [Alphaproteobacteria bacterium]|nr:PD-(D/E)XK nuclease family protein [Alphaproteobacteria bacterium]